MSPLGLRCWLSRQVIVLILTCCLAEGKDSDLLFQPLLGVRADPSDAGVSSQSVQDVVKELYSRLQQSQVQKDVPYRFPARWQQNKGLYPSDIKLNMAGSWHLEMVRDATSVFDNNMFATTWISICLLEAHYYAKVPPPSEAQLSLALQAINGYHDKNLPYNNSLMTFWPQAFNQSTNTWVSTPANLLHAFSVFDVVPAKVLEDILKLLGLSDVAQFIQSVLSMRSVFESAFHIPPDFDDTFVNLGVGALLKDLHAELPAAFAQWSAANTNLTSVTDSLRRYAYRPFSQDPNVNTVDVRTYYYMRHFLNASAARKEDIALVPTWVQNVEEARHGFYKGAAMPFTMNNVDVTASANCLYGLTSAVLSGLLPSDVLKDPVIRQIYVNTSAMIADQIDHDLYQRPDLELTYYPSAFEFYWFTARTLSRLETARQTSPLPEVMETVYSTLRPALEGPMTQAVTSKARTLGQDMVYWDDFLGDGDVDEHNHTVVRGEDRLFTTAVAVNALLTTWTIFNDNNRALAWRPGTTGEVRETVAKAVRFLSTYILGDTYRPWNVFFSGSIKGPSTMPFGFPANRIEYLNGTVIHNDQNFPTGGPFLFGVQGLVPEPQYQQLLQQKHFGEATPTHFTSYNQPGSYFPFWSSSAYTYANAMLALARYDCIGK